MSMDKPHVTELYVADGAHCISVATTICTSNTTRYRATEYVAKKKRDGTLFWKFFCRVGPPCHDYEAASGYGADRADELGIPLAYGVTNNSKAFDENDRLMRLLRKADKGPVFDPTF